MSGSYVFAYALIYWTKLFSETSHVQSERVGQAMGIAGKFSSSWDLAGGSLVKHGDRVILINRQTNH